VEVVQLLEVGVLEGIALLQVLQEETRLLRLNLALHLKLLLQLLLVRVVLVVLGLGLEQKEQTLYLVLKLPKVVDLVQDQMLLAEMVVVVAVVAQ
jgi:hypothetical protein